jgi:hypothetical protein
VKVAVGNGSWLGMIFLNDVGEGVFKTSFVAAATQEKLTQVFLVPGAGRGIFPLAFLFHERFLIRAGTVGKERRGAGRFNE